MLSGSAVTLSFGEFLLVTLVLMLWLGAVALIDLRTLRIPDWLSLPLVATGLALSALSPMPVLAAHLIGAGVAFLLMAGFGALHFRLRAVDGLGLGDAKLYAAAGAWLGWQALPLVLLIAAGGGLIWALVWRRAGQMAFGPWLALGFLLCWLGQALAYN